MLNADSGWDDTTPDDFGAKPPKNSDLGSKFEGIGAGISALGSVMDGYSNARALRQQAAMLEHSRDNANMTANQHAESLLRRGHQVLGAQSASIAENGLGFSGSAVDSLGQSAAALQFDVDNALYGGEIRGIDLNNQAMAARSSATNAITAGWITAASKLVSAAGQAMTGMPIPGG
jgi:hypothetical protein